MPTRLTILVILSAALGGCAVVPNAAFSYDPTKPQPKPVADAAQIAPLTNRIAQLQLELDEVRMKIAAQGNSFDRLPLYGEEHRIHRRLAPLQRELAQYASAR